MPLLSILVNNNFGVLTKVSGLFSRRGLNIRELSAGAVETSGIYRITILAEGDAAKLEQAFSQVRKLEDVREVWLFSEDNITTIESLLVKMQARREELKEVAEKYALQFSDLPDGLLLVKASGTVFEVESIIGELTRFKILELSRTGPAALPVRSSCHIASSLL